MSKETVNFKDKNVLVCGVARSGISACELLIALDAKVTISDLKKREELNEDDVFSLVQKGVRLYLGSNPNELVRDEKFDLLVLSPGIPVDLPFVDEAKALGVPVWGEVELAYRCCKAPVIAITGTNGKSTTTALTGQIMEAQYPNSKTLGNIGIPFCSEALNIPADSFAVVEISSFQMETAIHFRPLISAVLNITPDHVNRHKSLENYIAHKEKVFANQGENDFVVLNFDDLTCRGMWEKTKSKVCFFSRRFELPDGVFVKDGSIIVKFNDVYEKLMDRSEIKSSFDHILEDVLAAVSIAVCARVPMDVIRKVCREFNCLEHRVEFCGEINGVEYYNDSKATNVDSAVKALESISKPVLLIGGGQSKGSDYSDWVKLFKQKVKHAVVFGETADVIIETCRAFDYTAIDKVNSLKSAVDLCTQKAESGDCVLLSPACASLDMFDNYEQRGALFRSFVAELSGEADGEN